MDGAADRVASVAGGDLMYGARLKVQLAAFQDEFPGWKIWYVLLYPIGTRRRARPLRCDGHRRTGYTDGPVELAATVSDVIAGDAP